MLLYSTALVICVLAASVPGSANAECLNHPTDVIFVVDASTNSHDEFQKMLDFAINITNQLDIGVYDYKIGMMIFSRSYRSVFYLSKYNDRNDVINAIRATTHNILNTPVTDIGAALTYVRRTMATTSYGHRHGADLVVVTLISSPASYPASLPATGQRLKDDTGATVIAIGIGSKVSDADLAAIASDPAHKHRVAGFGDLSSAHWPVIMEICPNDWHTDTPQTGAALTVNDCPANIPRDQYLQLFRGTCYRFNVFNIRSFPDATKDCQRYGGTLVLIKNREINFFIQNELYYTYHISSSTWIGLVEQVESHDAGDGHYVWADGEVATYTNFGQVIGHDAKKNCIAIVPQISSSDAGRWREYHCDPADADIGESSRLRYVCQYTMIPTGPTTAAPQTSEPTDPPTDPTTKPTDPPTDPTTYPPTDPTIEPTDPPTDPTIEPTDPPINSTTGAPASNTTVASTVVTPEVSVNVTIAAPGKPTTLAPSAPSTGDLNPTTVAPTSVTTGAPGKPTTVAPAAPSSALPAKPTTVAPTNQGTQSSVAQTQVATVAPTVVTTVPATNQDTQSSVAPTVVTTVAPTVVTSGPATNQDTQSSVAPTFVTTVAPTVVTSGAATNQGTQSSVAQTQATSPASPTA